MSEAQPEAAKAFFYRIGVISDTHSVLDAKVYDIFAGVQLILHAGDIGREDLLTELEAIAPVLAVSGNVDGAPARGRPLSQQFESPAGRIAMTHGHLPVASSGNKQTLVTHFYAFHPNIIIFGHSHIPFLEEYEGVTLFNPGSAGHARWGKGPTVGLITVVQPGAAPCFEHVLLEP